MSNPSSLLALHAQVQQDLSYLGLPAKPWVLPQVHEGVAVDDVIVIGAGMAGLALGSSLKHLGLQARLIDKAPTGFEGPWATTARMETLRSPKELTGPALGIPSLTFRAWYVAQFGDAAWQVLDKIPRLQWADYLRWYRQVLDLTVHNQQEVVDLQPTDQGLVRVDVLDHLSAGQRRTWWARRVVLATGRDGLGGAWVPAWAQQIPRERWVHSSDTWDGARFAGQRVAVIGGGASAMDSAATALEHGAARVDLMIRRPELPRVNKSKGSGHPGMAHGYWALPDAWKWRFRHYINAQQVPPPRGSTLRVSRHANAFFHFGVPVTAVAVQPNGVLHLTTPKGVMATDQVIFSTGFRTNWRVRPEFAAIAPHVRVWGDRFAVPPGWEDDELADSPDLGDLFEFQPKSPQACPGLERVHCFNYAAALSQGAGAGDIPQISDGAQRLARGLAARFLTEDAQSQFDALEQYDEPELLGDEWSAAVFPNALEP